MKKPIKDYKNSYTETNEAAISKAEDFYMCEYIDAWVKKPGEENSDMKKEIE